MLIVKRLILIAALLYNIFYLYGDNPKLSAVISLVLICLWHVADLTDQVEKYRVEHRRQLIDDLRTKVIILESAADIMELKDGLKRLDRTPDEDTPDVSNGEGNTNS